MNKMIVIGVAVLALMGCKNKEHPISIHIDPAFNAIDPETNEVMFDKIAVFPFVSALHESEDPDNIAIQTMAKYFIPELDLRRDYNFISPHTVQYAVDVEELQDDCERFLAGYSRQKPPDLEFLKRLADILKCDAFLIPVVDTWQKDEVDMLEDATPVTYVGATITILDARSKVGEILFQATDEDYIEGARSEKADRSLVTSASGAVRSDLGGRLHRAPPFDDVAAQVIRALVNSLPPR